MRVEGVNPGKRGVQCRQRRVGQCGQRERVNAGRVEGANAEAQCGQRKGASIRAEGEEVEVNAGRGGGDIAGRVVNPGIRAGRQHGQRGQGRSMWVEGGVCQCGQSGKGSIWAEGERSMRAEGAGEVNVGSIGGVGQCGQSGKGQYGQTRRERSMRPEVEGVNVSIGERVNAGRGEGLNAGRHAGGSMRVEGKGLMRPEGRGSMRAEGRGSMQREGQCGQRGASMRAEGEGGVNPGRGVNLGRGYG